MIAAVYILSYLSLITELVFFHTPSVAETRKLMALNAESEVPGKKTAAIASLTKWQKQVVLVIPFLLIQVFFLLPWGYFCPKKELFIVLYSPKTFMLVLGSILVISGRVLTFCAMLFLQRENKQTENSYHLHTNGIFSLSRNPGLDGMFLFFLGFCLLFPSLYMVIGFIFYIVYMTFRVQIEEEYLVARFGSVYLQYKNKTKRYLLF